MQTLDGQPRVPGTIYGTRPPELDTLHPERRSGQQAWTLGFSNTQSPPLTLLHIYFNIL